MGVRILSHRSPHSVCLGLNGEKSMRFRRLPLCRPGSRCLPSMGLWMLLASLAWAAGASNDADSPASRLARPNGAPPPARQDAHRPASPAAAKPDASGLSRLARYAKLPLSFEPNRGQADPTVKFLSHGRGYGLFLTGNEAVLEVQGSGFRGQVSGVRDQVPASHSHASMATTGLPGILDPGPQTPDHGLENTDSFFRLKLLNADPKAEAAGGEELPDKVNYLIGNDRRQWRTNLPTYSQVRYRNVYPGIDLVYYGNQGGQL